METRLLEIVLLLVGFLSGLLSFTHILVPLFYGLPRVLVWTARRYLQWRTPFFYLLVPIFWLAIVFGIPFGLAIFSRGFDFYVAKSQVFGGGLLLAVIARLGKAISSETARLEARRDILNYTTPYLTAKGAISLRGLWSWGEVFNQSNAGFGLLPDRRYHDSTIAGLVGGQSPGLRDGHTFKLPSQFGRARSKHLARSGDILPPARADGS